MTTMQAITILFSPTAIALAAWSWRITRKTTKTLKEARRRLDEAQARIQRNKP